MLIFVFKYIILPDTIINLEQEKCEKLYADEIIKLPDKYENDIGFTCTGLYFNKKENIFLIGNAGKYKPDEKNFKATVEIVASDFSKIKKSIPCYLNFKNMRDIQGVANDIDGTIWICSYGENKIVHINEDGDKIESFYIKEPSGIAVDSRDNTLWILTNKFLYNCAYDGAIKKEIKVQIKGQDQLFLDENNNVIYFSAGADYFGDSYIYRVNLKTCEIKPLYVLKDSYAIEGISIIDDKLYVLNDGYYHDAKIPVNQVNIYNLHKN